MQTVWKHKCAHWSPDVGTFVKQLDEHRLHLDVTLCPLVSVKPMGICVEVIGMLMESGHVSTTLDAILGQCFR